MSASVTKNTPQIIIKLNIYNMLHVRQLRTLKTGTYTQMSMVTYNNGAPDLEYKLIFSDKTFAGLLFCYLCFQTSHYFIKETSQTIGIHCPSYHVITTQSLIERMTRTEEMLTSTYHSTTFLNVH